MDALITNVGLMISPLGRGAPSLDGGVHSRTRVEIRVREGRIVSVDPEGTSQGIETVIDAQAGVVIPGFVDPHTHLGQCGAEWRTDPPCDGESIATTLRHLLALGVTTLEVKAGEGDTSATELGQLKLVRQIRDTTPQQIVPTYVAAFGGSDGAETADRVARMIGETIPAIRRSRLAQFLDVRVFEGARADHEIRAVLRAARGAGLRLKIHVNPNDQASSFRLACSMEACSADHVLSLAEREADGLAHVGVTPVLVPCFAQATLASPTELMAQQSRLPLVAFGSNYDFAEGGIESPWVLLAIAAKRGWSFDEALCAMTLHAARALDLSDEIGSIEPGKRADLLILEDTDPAEAIRRIGRNPVREVVIGGRVVHRSS